MARHYRHKKATNGIFKMDLAAMNEFLYVLQQAPDKVRSGLAEVADKWGEMTRDSYRSKIQYAMGFKSKPKHAGKTPFYEVEWKNDNGLKINVGHQSFIAKFLEVGTKDHSIPHYTRNKNVRTVAFVRGITGSKALAKAFRERNDALGKLVADKINDILKM